MEQNNNLNKPATATQELEQKVWYAIRVTFNREMKVKDDLDLRGIESFIPMKYVMGTRRGRRVKKLVPTIHNLIFFRIEPSAMREYKATTKLPIRYIMNPATKKPVVVPDKEMQNFIAVLLSIVAAVTQKTKILYADTCHFLKNFVGYDLIKVFQCQCIVSVCH